MIGIFIFGCFITAMVATACVLIITGIRADKHELEGLDGQRSGQHPSSANTGV